VTLPFTGVRVSSVRAVGAVVGDAVEVEAECR